MPPIFSVVIPAYNQDEFLGDAIESVLSQTYQDIELIVVNDASPDHTEAVVRQFNDARIKYLVHSHNKGLPATRNTGIRASTGDWIALLDADDYFHPEKLAVHAHFLESHPEIGVTYNPRFDLNHSAKTICSLHRPKPVVDITDLVLGYPFSPSDMVVRRQWVEQVGLFDEALINGAEDLDYPYRLALAGCKFVSVDKALNYRRYYLNRARRDQHMRKQESDMVLNRIFQDIRCPEVVLALMNKAFSRHTLRFAFLSFTYQDTKFAQTLLREAVQKAPDIVQGDPAPIVDYFLLLTINTGVDDHGALLKMIFDQFPTELRFLSKQYDWAVKQGLLMRGTRAVIWENNVEAKKNFEQAHRIGAKLDETFLYKLFIQLNDIDEVIGLEACQLAISNLFPILRKFGKPSKLLALEGQLSAARAFKNYRENNYQETIRNTFDAFRKIPAFLPNMGVLSVFTRSFIKCFNRPRQK